MSKTIDEKVVSMQFDNKQFESNVKTTMSTLDRLKQSLNLTGAAKGLENLGTASKNVDMSGMSKALDTVHVKFSAFEVMAITALTNITNSAVNAGKRLIDSFTFEPIRTGFQEYELKMGSVQTIMAGTGESLEVVNKYLEELNEYSDKTIYSFADMTSNIGKFTNAGVKLEDAVSAIKGVSNEAAVSGANANEASRAMYNFAQALSAGYVKLIDWKSIENANMATVEFKDNLLQTAAGLGTVTKNADGMYVTLKGNALNATQNFNDCLQDQWMTTEVLVQTLKDYADETTDIGKKAYASAQDVKTFSMMMDTLKEAAQSGWAQTWELIVGDFEQAKSMWTNLSGIFGGMIDRMSDARNNLLKGALTNRWDQLTDKISDAGIEVETFQNVLKETAKEHGIYIDEIIEKRGSLANAAINGSWLTTGIVTDTLKKLAGDITTVGDATEKVTVNIEEFEDIVNRVIKGDFGNGADRVEALSKAGYEYATIQGLVNQKLLGTEFTMENLSNEQLASVGYTNEQIEALRALQAEAEATGTPLNYLIENMQKPTGRELLLESMQNILHGLTSTIGAVKDAWREVFPPKTAEDVYGLISVIHNLSEKLYVTDETADKMKRTFKGVFTIIKFFSTFIGGSFSVAFKIASKILGLFDLSIWDVTARIGDAIVGFKDFIDSHDILTKGIKYSVDFVLMLAGAIGKLVGWILQVPQVDFALASFGGSVKSVMTNSNDYVNDAKDVFKGFIDRIKSMDGISLSNIQNAVKDFKDNVFDHFINTDKIVENTKGIFEKFKDGVLLVLGLVGDGLKISMDGIKGFADFVLGIASKINVGKILAIMFGVTYMKLAFGFIDLMKDVKKAVEFLPAVSDTLKKFGTDLGSAIKTSAKTEGILKIAQSLAIIVGAIAVLTLLDPTKVGIACGVLAGVAVTLVGMMFTLSKIGDLKDMAKVTGLLMAMAGAVVILSIAMKNLVSVNVLDCIKGVSVIAVLLAELAISAALMSKLAPSMSKNVGMLLMMSVSILVLTTALKRVETLDGVKALANTLILAGVFTAMTLLMRNISNSGAHMLKASGSLILMTTSLLLMVHLIKKVSQLTTNELFAAITTMILTNVFFTIFARSMASTQNAGPYAMKAGGAILLMTGAVILMIQAVKMISSLDVGEIVKGTLVIGAMMGMFGLLIKTTKYAGPNAAKAGAMLIAMAGALMALSVVMYVLSSLDPTGVVRALGIVVVLETFFAGLIFVTKFAGSCMKELIVMSVAISILAAAVAGLSLIDPLKLMAASGSLALVISTFSILVATTSVAKSVTGTMLIVAGIVVALSGVLYILGSLPVESSLTAALSLSTLILTMSGCVALLSKVGMINPMAVLSLVAMTGVLVMLSGVLFILQGLELTTSIQSCIMLGTLLTAMSASLILLSVVGLGGPAALIGVASLMALITGVATMMMTLGALTTEMPKAKEWLENGLPILELIGQGLGSFFGNIVGGFINGVSSSFPKLGEDLAEFMSNAQPFFDGMSNVDMSVIDGVKALAETMLILTGTNIVNALMSPIIGNSSMKNFVNDLSELAPALVEFSDIVKDVDVDSVNGSANAAKTLAEFANNIPSHGGMKSWFVGDTDIKEFGEQLIAFGTAIKEYSTVITENGGIDVEAIEASANAAKSLSELANNLPNSGGVVGWFNGDNSMAQFGKELSVFAEGMVAYSSIITENGGIDSESIDSSVSAAKSLSELATNLPDSGGLKRWFMGDNQMSAFGSELVTFGKYLTEYSSIISQNGISADAVESSINAGKALSELAIAIPNMGGVKEWFTGSKSMVSFGTELTEFGKGFASYAQSIDGVNSSAVTSTSSAATALAELYNGIQGNSGWFDSEKTLASFGSDVSSFGDKFARYSNTVGSIDTAQLSLVITEVYRLARLGVTLSDVNSDAMSGFGDALKHISANGLNDFIQSFTDTQPKIIKVVEELLYNVITSVRTKEQPIVDSFTSIMNSSISAIVNRATSFNEVGEQLMRHFRRGITSSSDDISNGVSRTMNECVISLRSNYNEFYDAGKFMAEGMATGINNNTYKVIAKSKAMAKAAADGARQELDIHSPSRVFDEIGDYSGQGFVGALVRFASIAKDKGAALGRSAITGLSDKVTNMRSSLENSVSSVSNSAMDIIKDAVNSIYTMSDTDVNPTITPVVDLSNVSRSAGLIGNILNTNHSFGVNRINGSDIQARSNGWDKVEYAINGMSVDNSDVITALSEVQNELNNLRTDVTKIQVVFDTGAVAGAITPRVDSALCSTARLKGRTR